MNNFEFDVWFDDEDYYGITLGVAFDGRDNINRNTPDVCDIVQHYDMSEMEENIFSSDVDLTVKQVVDEIKQLKPHWKRAKWISKEWAY